MKDSSEQLARDAGNAANNPYRSQGLTHSAGPTSKGQGTPPAPSMPVAQKPLEPATWERPGSQGAYGNDY